MRGELILKKNEADRIIEEYVKPLYGFSMNKTRNINEAEELAGRIILQVYDVLIKRDSFIDLNTYVFKIAHNVWAKYVDDKTKVSNSLSIDEVNISSYLDIDRDILQYGVRQGPWGRLVSHRVWLLCHTRGCERAVLTDGRSGECRPPARARGTRRLNSQESPGWGNRTRAGLCWSA